MSFFKEDIQLIENFADFLKEVYFDELKNYSLIIKNQNSSNVKNFKDIKAIEEENSEIIEKNIQQEDPQLVNL